MKTNLKTFPSKNTIIVGDVDLNDIECHWPNYEVHQMIKWKQEFEAELREMLKEPLAFVESSRYGGDEYSAHKIGIVETLQEILGEETT